MVHERSYTMKITARRILSCALCVCMMIVCTMQIAYAKVPTSEDKWDTIDITVEDLLDCGYTREEADRLLEFDRVLKKMEEYGQKVDLDEKEEVYITVGSDGQNHLEQKEEALVKSMVLDMIQESQSATYTREQAYDQLATKIQEDPNQHVYTVQLGEHSMLRATVTYKDVPHDGIVTNGAPLLQDQYQFFEYGEKYIEYELEETLLGAYAKVQIEATAVSTEEQMELQGIRTAQASIGIIDIQNASRNVISEVATEVGDYCEASNDVVFSYEGSVGGTLKGVISLSISAGANWTQKAMIRAHKTSAFGIVWTMADVYTV